MPVQATDSTPSPELLELLGLFSSLEELGVDVDQQIESREALEKSQPVEPQQPLTVPNLDLNP